MTKRQTYYDILRVSHDAEPEVITAAHRTLMAKLKKHPDLGGDPAEAIQINRAYEVLSNEHERAVYDELLQRTREEDAHVKRASEKTPPERRRIARSSAEAVVSFCLQHDFHWHPARVKDISTLGLRLQAHVPLAIGQLLVIAPTNLAAPAMHGQVRWCRMFHPSIFERVYEAGVEFEDQIVDIEQRLSI